MSTLYFWSFWCYFNGQKMCFSFKNKNISKWPQTFERLCSSFLSSVVSSHSGSHWPWRVQKIAPDNIFQLLIALAIFRASMFLRKVAKLLQFSMANVISSKKAVVERIINTYWAAHVKDRIMLHGRPIQTHLPACPAWPLSQPGRSCKWELVLK